MIRVSRAVAIRLSRRSGDTVTIATRAKRTRPVMVDITFRKRVEQITVDLPMPPSKNDLWAWTPTGMKRSVKYMTWRTTAAKEVLIVQRAGCIVGPYTLTILACEADTDCDLGNLEAATSDLLQHTRVVENDKRARRIVSEWAPPFLLRSGIRAIVIKAGEEELVA